MGGTTSEGMLIRRSVRMRPMAGGWPLALEERSCDRAAREGFDEDFCAR